jgi:hypothetical protein
MKNKILFAFLSLALVFGAVGFTGTQIVHAQVAPSFPVGCTSNLGYSVTNGSPCNGTSIATQSIAGCTTALGYSVTTAVPCDGSSVAIQYLAGCSSIYGFSTISGNACNGTSTPTLQATTTTTTTTPGLPVTGAGSNVFVNIVLLLSSAIVAIVGSTYLIRRHKMNA